MVVQKAENFGWGKAKKQQKQRYAGTGVEYTSETE